MAQSSQPQSIAVRAACLRVVLVAHRVMYGLLELYQHRYNRDEPVVCVDEKSKQLLAPKQPDIPLKAGQTRKVDSLPLRQHP